MNVVETQKNYTDYQTQNSNSTAKTNSDDNFLNVLQEFSYNKNELNEKNEIVQEEFDEKYKKGLERYNALGIANGEKWFENSIFEKDQNSKNEFVKYLSDLSTKDYMNLSTKMWSSFGSGLVNDGNGNIVSGNHAKDPKKEFLSIESIKNYFEDEIDRLKEDAKKYGDNPTEMIELLTNVLDFFKNYQSKEQENKYQDLGNSLYVN